MADRLLPPPARPCESCPYRRDVPAGVWAASEYEKLPRYDGDPGDQAVAGATAVFMCHHATGRLCGGWVGCHDMTQMLALRVAVIQGLLSRDDVEAVLDYESPVPLFASGAEAAAHGLSEIEEPGPDATRVQGKIVRARARSDIPLRFSGG